MSDQLSQLISDIRSKALKINASLQEQRDENKLLESKINSKDEELNQFRSEIKSLKSEIDSLKEELENKVEPSVEMNSVSMNDEEIDELVNEIEFCIEQLKK